MLKAFFRIRYMSVLTVLASLLGALLMFLAAAAETGEAFMVFFGLKEAHPEGGTNLEVMVKMLSALDAALFGLALLYFAYSIYFLFTASDWAHETAAAIEMPDWLHVQSLGEMKKTLLEVVVVLLGVLFLKLGLETQKGPAWELLVIPVGIIALAASLKLIDFDH